MRAKAYKDSDRNYINAEYVIFEDDIEDDKYNQDWCMSAEKYYKQILEENQYIASREFKKYI